MSSSSNKRQHGESPSSGSETRADVPVRDRACDACRRMKIKCTDKENPPCKRCRTMKIECRFDMGPAARNGFEDSEVFVKATRTRLDSLEGQVGGITAKLDEISSFLRRMAAASGGVQLETPTSGSEPSPTTSAWQGAGGGGTSPMRPQPRPDPADPKHMLTPDILYADPLDSSTTIPWGTPLAGSNVLSSIAHPHDNAIGGGDEDDDDPLESAMRNEPFSLLTRKEEERRLRDEGLPVGKRRRIDSDMVGDWGRSPIREKGDALAGFADPVTLGWCSEADGRELFDAFFKHAHPFLPILDASVDTWEDPFCITVILWVALRARSGCRPASELTTKLKEHAEAMGKLTLFSPIATLETVQALVLLSSWDEHSWRICCHAMAMAVDMRLFRCLPYLHKIRTAAQQPHSMLERQRPLVAGARTWLALVKQTFEMSFNHALPVQFSCPPNERSAYARELLDHPLANLHDSRLVVSVELLECRETAFWPYQSVVNQSAEHVDEQLRKFNRETNQWQEHWHKHYRTIGLPSDHFLVKEIASQKAYAVLYTNSVAWYGVHNRSDVLRLSPERRQWLGAAMRSAAFLISSLGSGPQEKDSEFGNHNFHVGIVAVARYLLRMVELLPEVCDRYTISLDIDKLLLKMPYYPAHPFTPLLTSTLARARERNVIPYTSISDEAARAGVAASKGENVREPEVDSLPLGLDPLPWTQNEEAPAADINLVGVSWPIDFNLASWFPTDDLNNGHLQVDGSFNTDMSSWFPIAPQA